MKILSGTRTYIALAALAIVALLSFQALAQKPKPTQPPEPSVGQATFILKIRDTVPTKGSQADFEKVLDTLNTTLFDLYTTDEKGECKHHTKGNHKVCIRTDKVTTPESAKTDATGEVTYIQTRTTIQVPSMDSSDIKKVVDQLQ
jgi:hypothetical protein